MITREIRSSDAKARFSQILNDVERGETVVITRYGRAIARLVPERLERRVEVQQVIAEIREQGRKRDKISCEDILSARHEGHKS